MVRSREILIAITLIFMFMKCSNRSQIDFEVNKWYPLKESELFVDTRFEDFEGDYSKANNFDKKYREIYDDCIEDYGFEKIYWSVEIDEGLKDLSHSIKVVLSKFSNDRKFQKIREAQNDSTGIYEFVIGYEQEEYLFKASPYENMINIPHNIAELNRLLEEISPLYEFRYDPNHDLHMEILYGRKTDFEKAIKKGFSVNSRYVDWERISWKDARVNYLKFDHVPSENDLFRVSNDNWGMFLSYTLVKDFNYAPIIDDEKNMRRMYIEENSYLQYIENMLQ